MNWLRKWWIWLVLVLLLVAGGVAVKFWSKTNAAPEYKTSKIEKGAITASVSASGTLSAVRSVQVGSQVSGQLKEVLVDFNSEVKQGQLIARIDPETFQYKVRQAQADVDSARAQVMSQQANIAAQRAEVSRAEVNAADARSDLERKQQLMDKGFISAAERDKAQSTYNALAEQVKTAKAQVAVAQANAGGADAAVKQRLSVLAQANIDLERTAIKAPVSGVVIKRSVESGQTVAASLQSPELFVIAEDLTDMQVDTAIDESEIGRIRVGQKATFTVDAFAGRNFEGEVKQIRKAAQTVSNVVTYMVEVSAPNPGKDLLPGMTANVRVVTDARTDVLKVSNSALRFKPAGVAGSKTSAEAGRGERGSGARGNSGERAERSNGGGGGQNKALRERMEKDLQLSEDQKAKLDTIFSGSREKMTALREAPDAERGKLAERNRSEMQSQIAAILTPDQKKKYDDIAAEQSGRRGGNARGRIYVLDQHPQPKELPVQLGLSDGSMTEVMSPDVAEGLEVIVGVVQQGGSGKPAGGPGGPGGPRMF
ncbi:MAG: efflux RND transporter periplasmic adaptor subunit [Pseudomonadota bacterium]